MSRHRHYRPTGFLSFFKIGIVLACLTAAGSLFTPYPAQLVKALRGEEEKPAAAPKPKPKPAKVKPVEKPEPPPPAPKLSDYPVEAWDPVRSFDTPTLELPPFPPALPERVESGNFEHINSIAGGASLRSNVHFSPGGTATADRRRPEAYQVRISMDLFTPKAAMGEDLLRANPDLRSVLKEYDGLMSGAKVSPWFQSLYLHKQNRVRKQAATITDILDRHNYYDTDTILQIQAPKSGRRVLWIQADMDVVSDGSDGDRLPIMPEKIRKSEYYQPSTSYRWRKLGDTPNPLLSAWEERLEKRIKEKASKDSIQQARHVITDLRNYSFLLAEYDSFIVVPLTVNEGKDATWRPKPGDYAVVVVDDRVFPAIVGDFGPRFKTGEASLRLCKAVNPKSTVYARAVSNLGVSYIIFPGSKEEKNGPINYERLNSRCKELLDEIGGLGEGAKFQTMEDLLPQPAKKEEGSEQADK